MRRISLFLLFCFMLAPCIFADDNYGIRSRTFEIGIANSSIGLSNDLLSVSDIFQETAVIDIDGLKKGFNMNLDLGITPLHFSFNRDNNWGFGFSVGLNLTGIIDLSGSMITFGQAVNAKSDVGGGAFINAEIPIFFHISRFKVKVGPSVFYPLLFVEPDISYTNRIVTGGTELDLRYNMRVFTPASMEDGSLSGITAAPGIDLNLGIEFPFSDAIGLSRKVKFLDFKIGLDLYNLPLFPAQLNDYMEVFGRIGSDDPINILGDGLGDLMDYVSGGTEYGSQNIGVFRPFKLLTWADWQPFGPAFSLIPTVGFTYNPLYSRQLSLEYGLKTSLNLGNVFIATVGVGYYDRLWKNSLDLAINMRLMEINLGFDMRSADFIKKWQESGFGMNVGLKFGW
ncbi:MAG: hypothetical protein FWC06_06515 [Treponema sp.]|nr:hypothetical protein [Treponema sp.]